MENKKIKIFVILLLGIIFLNVVSAVCCEKLESGQWCQNVDDGALCDLGFQQRDGNCDEIPYCIKGTCVNSQTGKCRINTPQAECIDEGGIWKEEDATEVPACKQGCCFYGNKVAFVTQTECKQIASDYGVNIKFDETINSQDGCYALSNSQEEGACIIESEYEKTCLRTTKKDCLDMNEEKGSSKVLDIFNIPTKESSVNVDFYSGYLCSAEELETDCAPTGNTICEDDKVYFVDSCGQLGNVYDEKMYPVNNEESRDYWTKIQEPKCIISGTNSNSCGDCNYRSGTTCAKYERGDDGMPSSAPKNGNKVCRDLACYYDTNGDGKNERYEHGESWCAETEGTYPHLTKNFEEDKNVIEELLSLDGITEKYNIPGSRYVKLECRNGVVLEQPCKDYRNEFCVEETLAETKHKDGDGKYTQASCIANGWRNCFNFTSQGNCENADDFFQCKWVGGYRFDFANVKTNKAPLNYSEQGSCVPLISPGFEFWNNSGNAYQGIVKEIVFYEVHWLFDEKREQLLKDASFAAENCYTQNCYAIPGYASDISEEQWAEIWDGDKDSIDIKDDSDYLSEREGAYCHKKDDPSTPKTGSFTGDNPGCLDNEETKVYQPPIFASNTQWIESIILRARSLGDVGYKKSIGNYWGESSAERVVSIMQKLNQDMKVKKNMTEEFVMWEAGEYTDGNKRMTGWIGKKINELVSGGGK